LRLRAAGCSCAHLSSFERPAQAPGILISKLELLELMALGFRVTRRSPKSQGSCRLRLSAMANKRSDFSEPTGTPADG